MYSSISVLFCFENNDWQCFIIHHSDFMFVIILLYDSIYSIHLSCYIEQESQDGKIFKFQNICEISITFQ